jgi:hypothetical protein
MIGYVEIDPATTPGPAADAARRYLASRNPVVDRPLPDGAGRTRFFEDLDGMAGVAFLPLSAVGLAPTAGQGSWPKRLSCTNARTSCRPFCPSWCRG